MKCEIEGDHRHCRRQITNAASWIVHGTTGTCLRTNTPASAVVGIFADRSQPTVWEWPSRKLPKRVCMLMQRTSASKE